MSHLNSARVIAAQPLRDGTNITRSVRKIDNGYIVSESSWNEKTGKYTSCEAFSAEAPNDMMTRRGTVGAEGLSDTKRYLGNDV